ncbi:hypothetical protein STEG23_004610, partial [Scotinomys teguina]
MEYYAAEKNNDIMKFAGKWIELENVILSEVTDDTSVRLLSYYIQHPNAKHCVFHKGVTLGSGFSLDFPT